MIKRIAWIMTLVMLLSVLAGCAGTTVVVGNCTCPTEPAADNTPAAAEGALKTGLAIVAKTSDSTSATAEAEGKAKYDVTIAAVTVDDAGVIRSCIIDSVGTEAAFDATGNITTDLTMYFPQTKNELGEAYNMKAWGNAIAEWDVQTASFCQYVTGKTPEEVAGIAVSEGKASEADLAASVTITIDGFQNLIAKAAK